VSSINKQNKNLKFIDKKTESFSNVDRIHCVICLSSRVAFKKYFEKIPYSKKEFYLTSNVQCLNCGHTFMDTEWDNEREEKICTQIAK